MTEKKIKDLDIFLDWDDEPSESAMEKMNGGSTQICVKCDGSGMVDGEPCYSCGGTGWRR